MSAQWFYQTGGQQWGPIPAAELLRLAEAGVVMPDTAVRKGGDASWVPAKKVRGLFRQSNPPPLPTRAAQAAPTDRSEVTPPPAPPPSPSRPLGATGTLVRMDKQSWSRAGDLPSLANEVTKDQSNSFLGGIHHPWRRFFARTVDLLTLGMLLLLLLSILVGYFFPQNVGGYVKALQNPIAAGIILCLLWLPAEAALIATTSTTPAKWIFGISVLSGRGRKLSYSAALKRAFLVWIQGEGLGIPFVTFFTHLFAYGRLTKTGTTLWDTSVGSVVTHKKWGVIRAIICVFVVLGVMMIISILNQAPGVESAGSFPSEPSSRDGVAPSVDAPVTVQEHRNSFQEFTAAQADAKSHYLRGLAAAQNQEDFESAVQQFTEAIRIDSDYAEAYVARGCARLHKFNEHDLAIEDHTKAVTLQPDYALAYFHRADTYWDEGRNHEALNDCNKAISLAPRFAQAFWLRAQVLKRLEEHERARADLERAEQLGFGEDGRWYPWQDTSWQPWQEVTVPGVCKFTIPPTLEIQGGSYADLAGGFRHGMFEPDDSIKRVVIQPRGLNEFKGKAFDTYARVIVGVSRNPEESGLRQEELRALTPADLRKADEVLKQELIQQVESANVSGMKVRLLEWNPVKIVRLNHRYALSLGFRRQLGDNPPVQVQAYKVPIDDLQCEITVSYRESERSKWATDLEKVVSGFEFEQGQK